MAKLTTTPLKAINNLVAEEINKHLEFSLVNIFYPQVYIDLKMQEDIPETTVKENGV